VIYVAAYLGVCWAFSFNAAEKELLATLVGKVLRRG
jgi:hypothetical protein